MKVEAAIPHDPERSPLPDCIFFFSEVLLDRNEK